MPLRYTARIYSEAEIIAEEQGDDPDELQNWMLVKAQGKFGDCHGKIIDNQTKKVVKRFRKCPSD